MAKIHENSFWKADEIDYVSDKNQWNRLTNDEKFFIELTAIAEEVKSTVDRVYAEKARRKKEQDKNPDQTVIVAAPVSFDDVDDSVRTDYEDRFIECINRHTFMDITFQIGRAHV